MKKVLGIIILVICIFSISYANFIMYEINKLDVTINNIDEPIKSIWLVIEDSDCDIQKVYENSELDFSKANILSNTQYDIESDNKNNAYFEEGVEPFTEEDYVFNDNYDKENYHVYFSIYYSYDIEDELGNSIGFGMGRKCKNMDEVLANTLDNEYEKYQDTLTCSRSVEYTAYKLIEKEEIPVSEIVDGTLKVSIDDFSELKDNKNAFSLRFEKADGEFIIVPLGSNKMHRSHEEAPDSTEIEGYRADEIDFRNYTGKNKSETAIESEPAIEIETTVKEITIAEEESPEKHYMIFIALMVIIIAVVLVFELKKEKNNEDID